MDNDADLSGVIIPISKTQGILLESGRVAVSKWKVKRKQGLTAHEVSRIAKSLEQGLQAVIESKKMTGRLVELDPTSAALLKTARKTKEAGGWIQTTLRTDRGTYLRVMRIRPSTAVGMINPAAAVLGAVASQAQTAELARDIKDTLDRVKSLQEHVANERHGDVRGLVQEISLQVAVARAHGADEIAESAITGCRLSAHQLLATTLKDLESGVAHLDARDSKRPSKARAHLTTNHAKDVEVALDDASLLLAACEQLYALEVARLFALGKHAVAQTTLDLMVEARDQAATRINTQLEILKEISDHTHGLEKAFWRRTLGVPTTAGGATIGATAVTAGFAASRTGVLLAAQVPLRIAGSPAAVAGLAIGGAWATREKFAENNNREVLAVLESSTRSTETTVGEVLRASGQLQELTKALRVVS